MAEVTIPSAAAVVAESPDIQSAVEEFEAAVTGEQGQEEASVEVPEVEGETTGGEPEEQAAEEQKAAEPQISPEEQKLLDMIQLKEVKEALKGIGNDKVRRRLVGDHIMAREVRRSGIEVGDIPEYLNIAPTVEDLRTLANGAYASSYMNTALSRGTEGVREFVDVLTKFNPAGLKTLQNYFYDNVETIDPERHVRTGDSFAGQIASALKYWASDPRVNRTGISPEDLTFASEVLEQALNLNARKPVTYDAETTRRLEEADRIKKEYEDLKAKRDNQRAEAFNSAVFNAAGALVDKEVESWVRSRAGGYEDNAKAEIYNRIKPLLYKAILTNNAIRATVNRLQGAGNGSAEHINVIATHVAKAARALLPRVGAYVVKDVNKLVRSNVVRKEERARAVASAPSRMTASGKPSVAPKTKPINPRNFTSAEAYLDELTKSGINPFK